MRGGGLPVVSGRQVVRALQRAGFIVDRIVGSHYVITYPGNPARTVTVPVHANTDLKPGTLRNIIKQAGYTVEEFVKLL